jgi:hypothetical protein
LTGKWTSAVDFEVEKDSIETWRQQVRQKFLFFDIDGTLVNFETQMPESAKTALREA